MSLKSNSIKSENKSNTSIQLSDQMSQMRGSVDKSIGEDLSLLKTSIDFSQFTHSMPELKKISKNFSINESEIKTKLDEINSKMDSFHSNDDYIEIEGKHFQSLSQTCNRLHKLFPTFKQMTNTFTDKNPNNDNSFNRKQIEISDQKIDQLVKSGQRMEYLENSNKYLKKFQH